MFTMTVRTSNAAFDDPERGGAGRSELSRLLRLAADRVDEGVDDASLFDFNGNAVAEYSIDAPLPCEAPA